jgi:hypothetical protein
VQNNKCISHFLLCGWCDRWFAQVLDARNDIRHETQAKAQLRMGLEDITDTSGSLGGLKWFGFFGASFVPSLFLAGYFLGGYYPGMIVGAPAEPDWWPTSMQVSFYSLGVFLFV